jgi:hypothetical protein
MNFTSGFLPGKSSVIRIYSSHERSREAMCQPYQCLLTQEHAA